MQTLKAVQSVSPVLNPDGLEAQTNRLETAIDELSQQVELLANQLLPVMSATPPTGEDCDGKEVTQDAPAVERIAVQRRSVQRLYHAVADIRSRLAIT